MKPAPQWAQDLLLNAILVFKPKSELPTLKWMHKHTGYSTSGCCDWQYRKQISIAVGSGRRDTKIILLHEIAHWLTAGEHHSSKFWDMAFRLYQWAGIPLRVCEARERGYRKGATLAYKRIKALSKAEK